jgi:phosphoribosyl 1,2-cyclic phosphodiesterase
MLLDVGVSIKQLHHLLQSREKTIDDITHVFITHEHADHVRGLKALLNKRKMPVYANERTWQALKLDGDVYVPIRTNDSVAIHAITATSFPTSHDAVDPVAYTFRANEVSLCIATDLGYVSGVVAEHIAAADVLVIEANHDVDMLRAGRIPWNVKRRILSDTGHLSNDATATAVQRHLTQRTRRVYLAHMSQNHNTAHIAHMTVHQALAERPITLHGTYALQATPWDEL